MRAWVGVAAIALSGWGLGGEPAHAEPPRLAALLDLPRSPTLEPEPLAKPWQTQARVDVDRFDLFFNYSLISYAAADKGDRWHPYLRLGPGLYMKRPRRLNYAYLAWELSRFSHTTAGVYLHTLDMRSRWGAGVSATIDDFGRPGAGISLCWMNACLDVQVRDTEDYGPTILTSASATGWVMWLYEAVRSKSETR